MTPSVELDATAELPQGGLAAVGSFRDAAELLAREHTSYVEDEFLLRSPFIYAFLFFFPCKACFNRCYKSQLAS